MSNPQLIIISGKNPLTARSGYASYSYNLGKITNQLGYAPKIFCFGPKNSLQNSPIGQVVTINSFIYHLPLIKDIEMIALPLLSFELFWHLPRQKSIIWGVGPWTLAGAILKFFYPKKITLFADYFTTIKHEFMGSVEAINSSDYSLQTKLQHLLVNLLVIPPYSLLEKFILNQADKIITHYRSTENILSDQFYLKRQKFVRLPYCVEIFPRPEIFNKTPLPPPPIILLVARHDGRKGINYLLHAFKIMEDKRLKFSAVIIGSGPLLEIHQRLAKKLQLKSLKLLGFVPDLKPFMAHANLYVFSSVEEGSSALSILEAMKQGLPIVCTDVDGMSEDIRNNRSALLVPPKNSLALALAMEKLLLNPSLAKRLGKEAKTAYEKKFNFARTCVSIRRFLETTDHAK